MSPQCSVTTGECTLLPPGLEVLNRETVSAVWEATGAERTGVSDAESSLDEVNREVRLPKTTSSQRQPFQTINPV